MAGQGALVVHIQPRRREVSVHYPAFGSSPLLGTPSMYLDKLSHCPEVNVVRGHFLRKDTRTSPRATLCSSSDLRRLDLRTICINIICDKGYPQAVMQSSLLLCRDIQPDEGREHRDRTCCKECVKEGGKGKAEISSSDAA